MVQMHHPKTNATIDNIDPRAVKTYEASGWKVIKERKPKSKNDSEPAGSDKS